MSQETLAPAPPSPRLFDLSLNVLTVTGKAIHRPTAVPATHRPAAKPPQGVGLSRNGHRQHRSGPVR